MSTLEKPLDRDISLLTFVKLEKIFIVGFLVSAAILAILIWLAVDEIMTASEGTFGIMILFALGVLGFGIGVAKAYYFRNSPNSYSDAEIAEVTN